MKKIFVMIPLLLILFTVPVRAATDLPALPEDGRNGYLIIFSSYYNRYELFTFNNNNDDIMLHDFYGAHVDSSILFPSDYTRYYYSEGKWEEFYSSSKDSSSLINLSDVKYSTCNIVREDTGKVVFTKAPIRVSLTELVQRAKVGAVMETVKKMVPTVMIVVVGFLGLLKALTLLKNILRRA